MIRDRIINHLSDIEITLDTKDLENHNHDIVHSQLNRGRNACDDHDEEDAGWGSSMLLALGSMARRFYCWPDAETVRIRSKLNGAM
ncbi:MAG: hypothetical protein VYA69_14815 [Gemmatimonadota bacterium]|nr:hypothetical protein [Gemmatimonadota bacterium]